MGASKNKTQHSRPQTQKSTRVQGSRLWQDVWDLLVPISRWMTHQQKPSGSCDCTAFTAALKPETESSSGSGTSTYVQDPGPWAVRDLKQNVPWTLPPRNFLDCSSRLWGWYIVSRCHFSSQKAKEAPYHQHELKFLSIALDTLFPTLPGLFSMTWE